MFSFKKQLIASISFFVLALMTTLVTTSSVQAQDPGSTAWQDSRTFDFQQQDKLLVGFSVPHGHRLVVERLTAEVSVPPTVRIVNTTLTTFVNGVGAEHVLPRAVPLSSSQGDDNYSFFLTPNLYADSGNFLQFRVYLSVSCNSSLNVTLSGHLVCPGTLNCNPGPAGASLKGNSDDPAAPSQDRGADAAVAAQTRPRFATKKETVAMRIGQ